MFGNIDEIRENSYGFINPEGEDSHRRIFFHKSKLVNCTMRELEEGDSVEFSIGVGRDGRDTAVNVRKRFHSSEQKKKVGKGIHPSAEARLGHFNDDEKRIIMNSLKEVFYVSNSGNVITIAGNIYKYCLIKPTDYYIRAFQLNREIVVVFADFLYFEPRSLDVAGEVYKREASKFRLDRGCQVLICHDSKVEEKLADCLKDGNIDQVVIPFTYDELLRPAELEETVQERFRKYLFDTDLFAVTHPIRNDVFYFGRRDYLQDIVSKCKAGKPSGVFGLRRSGKTSLLYGVRNQLRHQGYHTVFVSCESELSNLDWQAALCKVVLDVYQELGIDNNAIHESDYRSADVSTYFEEDLNHALDRIDQPITIMFDEIEAISFGVTLGEGSDDLWIDGKNYFRFWNQIKGYYNKYEKRISILIAGTNPTINDTPVIGENKTPNPMFGQFSSSNQGAYLPPHNVK